ncbi:hypothetical protein T4D_11755, partial [Trichinella pseudospiralis]
MYSTFLLASPLFKTGYIYMEMLMKQRKVKAGMTPSKSWTTHRKKEMRRGTLRGVLTKSVFCYGVFCQI